MVLEMPSENRAEEIWVGSLFQTWDAVDEKDLEVATDVFLNGYSITMRST